MGKDGYASPDDGRRRKKAGARVGSVRLSSWQMGAIGVVGAVVLAGLLAMIALGVVAFSRSQDAREGGGDFLASVQTACLPNSTTMVFTAGNGLDRSTESNITTLLVERVGDLVSVTLQFVQPYKDTFDSNNLDTTAFGFFFDADCIPPASGFYTCQSYEHACDQNIPDADPSNSMINMSIPDFFVQYGFDAMIGQDGGPHPYFVFSWVPVMASPSFDGSLTYYGAFPDFYDAGLDDLATIIGVSMSLTYYTNASSGWTIPSKCKGGTCQLPA